MMRHGLIFIDGRRSDGCYDAKNRSIMELSMTIAEPFHIIAHRGASAYAPENTMAAFRLAVEMGIHEIETDVGYTRDGAILLFHDTTLDRTTSGSGSPGDYTLAELKQLDAGSWGTRPMPEGSQEPPVSWTRDYAGEQLITLHELLDEFGEQFIYHIEIKRPAPGLVTDVLAALRERQLLDHVYMNTINHFESLLEVRQQEPSVKTAWSPVNLLRGDGDGRDVVRQAADHGITMFVFNSSTLDPELVSLANELGMETRCSGIKHREHMIEAIEAGCNGMTINWPDWLTDYVKQSRK
jgi:glycerophosphoryl diester phosphodiesterase